MGLCLTIQYLLDRWLLTWYWEWPKYSDNKIHIIFVRIIMIAPFIAGFVNFEAEIGRMEYFGTKFVILNCTLFAILFLLSFLECCYLDPKKEKREIKLLL